MPTAEITVLRPVPLGNGTRQPGFILGTLVAESIVEIVQEIQSSKSLDFGKLKTGDATLAEGVLEIEVFNALRNADCCRIGKPETPKAEPMTMPEIDPSLLESGGDQTDLRDKMAVEISSVSKFNEDTKAALAKAGLKTVGDVILYWNNNGRSLQSIDGIGEAKETAILQFIKGEPESSGAD